jgi:hypothetical protein
VSKHEIGILSKIAVAVACLFGLACAASAGRAGLLAAAWIGLTLVFAWHRVAPRIGTTAIGLAAIYCLAALAGFGGSDPEDVSPIAPVTSVKLVVVAFGCAVVGITCAMVWIADRSRSLR